MNWKPLVLVLALLYVVTGEPYVVEGVDVPDWIKNNARWWTEGRINDSDFVLGIEFLINNEIITVPIIPTPQNEEGEIPAWIKNTARWWVDDVISDDEFLNAIAHLVKIGVISVDIPMKIILPFEEGSAIPKEFTCDGDDLSPPLHFVNVPEATKSLVLIVDDPDAPLGTFVHWLVWNISPEDLRFEKGEEIPYPQGITGFGTAGYGGPCPPSGTHRYFFKLYALDTLLELDPSADVNMLERALEGHIISEAKTMGVYSRE